MLRELVFITLALILFNPWQIIAQEKAVHEKPRSSSGDRFEYFNESETGIGKADLSKNYSLDFTDKKISNYPQSDILSRKEERYEPSTGNFIGYTGYSKNYFRLDKDDNSLWNGKHWEYANFPLKVFVKKTPSGYFKEKYLTYIDYAFKIWGATDSRISFSYTSSAKNADIIFSFENNLMEKYDENYLGLTDYELGRNNRIIRAFIEIGLLKFDSKKISDGEIKSTIIHELGHALGLGHSNNKIDLMYPYINAASSDKMTYVELSKGDIEAIKSVLDLNKRNGYSSK